jgi:GntR family transcriptional regulator/MocR family aminotransferase
MWQQLLKLSRSRDDGLQVQLRKALTAAIAARHITPEMPLPSSRDLARLLSISRSTVSLAYQQLVDEGYLVSRERQGYYVNPDIIATLPRPAATTAEVSRHQDWSGRLKFQVTAQRNIHKPRDWYRYDYPFIFAQMDRELLPLAAWRECWRKAQSAQGITEAGYDLLDQDHSSLAQQLCTRVLPRRGIWSQPENILITLGAQNALALLARLLIRSSDAVGFENPGYPDARNLFELESENVKLLALDDNGLLVDDELDGCDYIYVTPSYQSPTTVTMPAERRRALLQKADDRDIVIIEDDYESEAAYGDEPIPALKSEDDTGRVVYCGSLSKTLAPGLRVGFLVADPDLINEARALRRLLLRHPPPLIEHAAALFIELGHYDSHVARLSKAYKERWTIMAGAVDTWFPFTERRRNFGGTSFWITGPTWLDAGRLATLAAERSILIEPGAVHFAGPDIPTNYFRLGFSAIANDRIEPGIKLIAELIDELAPRE